MVSPTYTELTIIRVSCKTKTSITVPSFAICCVFTPRAFRVNLLNPTGYVMHQQFNIQQLCALPTLHLCVLYLSENKQRLLPLTA